MLPVGITPPNPLELVERPAFGLLMRELVSKFDHVVVDTPAAEYGADASVIAARCGAALVMARKNASRMGALQDLVADLRSKHLPSWPASSSTSSEAGAAEVAAGGTKAASGACRSCRQASMYGCSAGCSLALRCSTCRPM